MVKIKEFLGIPQGNQIFHPSNILTDYLKQTGIMEPLITDYFRYLCLLERIYERQPKNKTLSVPKANS